jgi:hypothetical protein
MNGWLFGVCLVLVLVGSFAGMNFIGEQTFKRSGTRGGFSLKVFFLGLGFWVPCVMFWRWLNSALDLAAIYHLVPLTSRGDADPPMNSVGGLLFFFFLALSILASVFIAIGGIGLLTSNTTRSSGRVAVVTSYHCPHCTTVIKPFDFPTRGQATCRACGRVFKV